MTPVDYAGFPEWTLPAGGDLYRIHRHSPDDDRWWCYFSVSGDSRFDITPEGTLYGGERGLSALLETARGVTLLSTAWRDDRRLTTIRMSADLRLADTTHPAAYAWGVTTTIACGADYADPQRLARALADAGFDGIRYVTRHDVAVGQRSTALFGNDTVLAVLDASEVETCAIPAALVDEARPYGIRAVADLPPEAEPDTGRATSGATG